MASIYFVINELKNDQNNKIKMSAEQNQKNK